MKKIALITASLAVLASPAFAEDSKTVGTAPAEAKYSTVTKDEMFSSKLKGLNVTNQKDESVGEITDLAIKNHEVDALILSVGGFLGMGEHYVAVSPSSVNIRYDEERKMAGVDEHHQGRDEGRTGVQVSEAPNKRRKCESSEGRR